MADHRTAPLVPPPAVALAAAVAQRALTADATPPSAPRRLLGLVIGAASVACSSAGAVQFRSAGTTIDPHHPERTSSLVTDGVFQLTRNPMYVGLGGLLTARALHRGGLLGFLPVVGFAAWLDRLQVPAEESALAGHFGEEYDVYRAKVSRWIGLPG